MSYEGVYPLAGNPEAKISNQTGGIVHANYYLLDIVNVLCTM